MTFTGWLTIVLFAAILTSLAIPFGGYMAKVYTGKRVFLSPILAGPERFLYGVLQVFISSNYNSYIQVNLFGAAYSFYFTLLYGTQ